MTDRQERPKPIWTVGQRVYLVWDNSRERMHCTIIKIGHKYGMLDNERKDKFCLTDGRLSEQRHGDRGGRVWASEAEYEARKLLNASWNDLTHRMRCIRKVPRGVTLEAIATARVLLFPPEPATTETP